MRAALLPLPGSSGNCFWRSYIYNLKKHSKQKKGEIGNERQIFFPIHPRKRIQS
jgi:hypothetical protein